MGFLGDMGQKLTDWYRQPGDQQQQAAPQEQPMPQMPNFQAHAPMGMDQARQNYDVAGQRAAWTEGQLGGLQAQQKRQGDDIMQAGIAQREQDVADMAKMREEQTLDFQRRSDSIQRQIRSQAQQEIDPSKFFKDRGAWGSIMLGLSVAIGGYLNPRGPNLALQAIEKKIDQEIQVQDANLARKDRGLALEEKALDRDRDLAGDMMKTKEWRSAQVWELVGIKAKQMAERTTDQMAKATAMDIAAQAEKKSAEVAFKLASDQAQRDNAVKVARINATPGIMAQNQRRREYDQDQRDQAIYGKKAMWAAEDAKTRRMTAEAAQTRAETQQQGAVRTIQDPVSGDVIGHVPKEIYKETHSKLIEYQNVYDLIDDINGRAAKQGLWDRRSDVLNTGGQLDHEIRAAYASLHPAIANLKKRGANITKNEEEWIYGSVGAGPDTWTTKEMYDRLKFTEMVLHRERDRLLSGSVIERRGNGDGQAAPGKAAEPQLSDEDDED